MEPFQCQKCGQTIHEWVQFCPDCAEPIEGYARPAGFWIRVGAYIVDFLVFLPIVGLSTWNTFSYKSLPLQIAIALPGFFYKPFMESFCGATLGKMACGLKVTDEKGNKLSLFRAYARSLFFLVATGLNLAIQIMTFQSPEFQAAKTFIEAAQVRPEGFLNVINSLVGLFVLIDCIIVAFTPRKRALHDMLAESYVVYKQP